MARGLRCAAKLLGEGIIPRAVKVPPLTLPIPPHCSVSVFHLACSLSPLPPSQERYSSYDTGIGAKIESGETNFEELEVEVQCMLAIVPTRDCLPLSLQAYVLQHGLPEAPSGQQEQYEVWLNRYT